MNFKKKYSAKKGSIEVICGSMFSGKTEELLRRLKRGLFAKKKIIVFKPNIDVRYDEKKIVSHNKNQINSIIIKTPKEILGFVTDEDIIGVDEAQFFNASLINICTILANNGKRVIITGLDMDFLGNPFNPIPQLLSIAEKITKLHAICVDCGGLANHSFRKNNERKLIKLGEQDIYKPLCRTCFYNLQKTNK